MFHRDREEISFWPALADLTLAILLLVLVLWIADAGLRAVSEAKSPRLKADQVAVLKSEWDVRDKELKAAVEEARTRVKLEPGQQVVKTEELDRLRIMAARRVELLPGEQVIKTKDLEKRVELKPDEQIAKVDDIKELERLREEIKRRPDKPLVFPLEEASGFAFKSGKAELSPEFAENLKGVIVPKIREITGEFNIEVMEVIGHTDGQPVGGQSNFDTELNGLVLRPGADIDIQKLRAGSNSDLGLARALAVASFLQSEFARSGNEKLSTLSCRAYSGAQLISPATNTVVGASNKDDASRRRIELRFTWNPKRTP